MKDLARTLVLLAPGLLAGCDALDSPKDTDVPQNGDLGPCIHYIDGEVLNIDQAVGASTGAIIAQVRLNTFTVNGNPFSAEDVYRSSSTNLVLDNPDLICTLPCSMGYVSGQWQFTAEAPGYDPTLQQVNAAYATHSGNCPSYESNGTHVSIALDEP